MAARPSRRDVSSDNDVCFPSKVVNLTIVFWRLDKRYKSVEDMYTEAGPTH